MPSRILPLSEDAISRIHSSKQITSLPGVVLALLQNSLDAGSTKIDVSVNFARGSCTVEDNGAGIPHVEFVGDGGLGKLHHTSKATAEQPLHGSTGTYLASLAALSLLHITSQHSEESASSSISFHQGRVISRQISSHPNDELAAFGSCGTQIVVNDLFGNMPVRVKQRALSSDSGSTERSWVGLKRDVAALLLAWRTPCSIKLRDNENHQRNLTLSGSHHNVSSSLTERNLNQLQGRKVRYDLRDAFPVVFQAGLAPFDTRARWVPVSASTSKLSCRGLICLDPAPTRLCQFVSVGIHPYLASDGSFVIYDAINKAFSDSSFGTIDQGERSSITEKTQSMEYKDSTIPGLKGRQTRTSKGVDRWPMFIMQLEMKHQEGKTASDSDDHHVKAIIEVLEAVMNQWLNANNFRPRQKRKPEIENRVASLTALKSPQHSVKGPDVVHVHGTGSAHSVSPDRATGSSSKRQRIIETTGDQTTSQPTTATREGFVSDVTHLSKIRKGVRHPLVTPDERHGSSTARVVNPPESPHQNHSAHFTLPPLECGALGTGHNSKTSQRRASSEPRSRDVKTSSDDYGSVSDTDLLKAAESVRRSGEAPSRGEDQANPNNTKDRDDMVVWQDPITKEMFKVNSRTGIVLQATDILSTADSATARLRPTSIGTATTPAGRPLTLVGRAASTDLQQSGRTAPSFLQDWHNPIFERQTEQQIPVASSVYTDVELAGKANASNYFATSGHGMQSKLSKASLRRIQVINQVDAKFILCVMPGDRNRDTLVLVDQHAASERVILESLLRDLCSPIDATSPTARLRTNVGCVSSVAAALLEQPIIFEVTSEESSLFRSHAQHFARYGILYDIHTVSRTKQSHSLATRALPPGIAERCRLFPKLLIDLLRSEIWSRVETGNQTKAAPLPTSTASNRDHSWLERMGSCPKGLLDMLNSRACRSAVMFNDVLSVRECEDLLGHLGKCAFPFMCAHGRVSMVPVGGIGEGGVSGHVVGEGLGEERESEKVEGFGSAWRKWKGGDVKIGNAVIN